MALVDIAATPDGAGWAIGGDGVLYRQASPGATPEAVLDILAYSGLGLAVVLLAVTITRGSLTVG